MKKVVIGDKEITFTAMSVSMQGDDVTVHIQTDEDSIVTPATPATVSSAAPTEESILNLNFQNLDVFLTSLLNALQVPAHRCGYEYLRRSIELALENPQMYISITKILYPRLADDFEVNETRIERNIHGVITDMLDGEAIEEMKAFFGKDYEFLATRRSNAYILSLFITHIRLILARHPLETPIPEMND